MKTTRLIGTFTLFVTLAAWAPSGTAADTGAPSTPPKAQIALLLDTSNSMDGLIGQAKAQLWKVVNEFIHASQKGQKPILEVALYEYGKSSLPAENGFLRQVLGFTTDLDKVSEELMALKTNGGDEYCGWVIREAVNNLAWSSNSTDFKVVFIAGNEPFTQGKVDYVTACQNAIQRGIVINTIHCGTKAIGIQTKWQDGALLADGTFAVIDQNAVVARVEAPQDQEITRLGVELNKTYVAYGRAGRESALRQEMQDRQSMALAPHGSALERALCKASDNYRNGAWDLVDACREGKLEIGSLPAAEIPEELVKLTVPERKAYIEAKTKERASLQQRIVQLNAERVRFVANATRGAAVTNTLDTAMIQSIREQAARRHYRFE